MNKILRISLFFALALVLCVSAAADTMNGSAFNLSSVFPNQGDTFDGPHAIVGGPGGSVVLIGVYTLGVNDNTITANQFQLSAGWCGCNFQTFNGWHVQATDGYQFTSVSIDNITNMVGFDGSRISWDSSNVYVDWQGLPYNPDTIVQLDVNGTRDTEVPEPGSLFLFGSGLVGAAGALRRKLSV